MPWLSEPDENLSQTQRATQEGTTYRAPTHAKIGHCNEELGVAALDAAALCGPIDESLELVAVAPTELEEFSGVEIRGFLTKKGFQAPLDIGATPRCEAIAARGNPIITERSNHSCTSIWPG